MKKILLYIVYITVMVALDLLYLFAFMKNKEFSLEPFIVFLGIEIFIVVFISKLKSFLAK